MITDKKPRFDNIPANKLKMILNKTIPNGDCLEWGGNYFINKSKVKTYPYIYFRNKIWRGNRLVWFLKNGTIPENNVICHSCDNKKCINPEHLFAGTSQQNNLDMATKGRCAGQKKTKCKRGHAFNEANTAITTRADGRKYRQCRLCKKILNDINNERNRKNENR